MFNRLVCKTYWIRNGTKYEKGEWGTVLVVAVPKCKGILIKVRQKEAFDYDHKARGSQLSLLQTI